MKEAGIRDVIKRIVRRVRDEARMQELARKVRENEDLSLEESRELYRDVDFGDKLPLSKKRDLDVDWTDHAEYRGELRDVDSDAFNEAIRDWLKERLIKKGPDSKKVRMKLPGKGTAVVDYDLKQKPADADVVTVWATEDMKEARELLSIAREIVAENLAELMAAKGKSKRKKVTPWDVAFDVGRAMKTKGMDSTFYPGLINFAPTVGGQRLEISFQFPFRITEPLEARAIIYRDGTTRDEMAKTGAKLKLDFYKMDVRDAAKLLDRQIEKFKKWGQRYVTAPSAIVDILPELDIKSVKVRVGNEDVAYKPKYQHGSWWWWVDKKDSSPSLMSYYTLDLKDRSTPVEPGNVIQMQLRGGFVGGHSQQTIPVKLRIKKDAVKEMEDFLNRKAPKMWSDFIKRNLKKLIETDKNTSKALSDYYSKPGYKGD
jgi:hypothetical protein